MATRSAATPSVMSLTTCTLAVAGMALAVFAGFGCQRETQDTRDIRSELQAILDDVRQVVRDEIDILEDLAGRPGQSTLEPLWRDHLAAAQGAVERLAALRSEVDASTTAEIEAAVADRVLSEVREIRRALNERIRNLQEEIGRPRQV